MLVDDYTRFAWLYPLRYKSDFFQIFTAFKKLVETQFDTKVKEFQSDGGGEFVNTQMKHFLQENGIVHRISCPHTPEQNGLAEKRHRHFTELGLSMMYQCQLPLNLWVEAFATASYISNLLPSSALNNKSPYEMLFKVKPSYRALRVFGSACHPCLRPYQANKSDPKSLQCVFVGYSALHKGYRCLLPPTGKVYISRHVVFDETLFPFKDQFKHLVPSYDTALLQAWQSATVVETEVQDEPQISRFISIPQTPAAHVEATPQVEPVAVAQQSPPPPTPPPVPVIPPIPPVHPMQTRAKAGVHKPNKRYALVAPRYSVSIPKNIAEAMKHPGWNGAVSQEMQIIHMLNTWTLVPPTDDMNILSSRWVHTIKLNPDGTVKKLRSRLVARGYEQEEGLDYLETFSPVVRTATIRLMLNIAVKMGWQIKQLDVSSAFLHGELQEPVFMYQPEGFVDPEKPHYVCKLTKALYGLKQAPRAWFDTFSNYLIDFGFVCSTSDPSLFTYCRDNAFMVLLLYVDDILLTGSSDQLLQIFVSSLSKQYSMKDMGRSSYFLGIEMETLDDGLFLHQQAYIKDILHVAAMTDCKPMPTPLPQRIEVIDDSLFEEPTYFRSLAGKLQYLTITRPDIQYAVNLVCQRMHAPTVTDFGLLKRVLRYLKGTMEHGLRIMKSADLSLMAYCDSDWGGCQETKRSTTGFCTILGSNLVSWSAKRQDTVSRSSTEAEYRALAETAQEITWISQLLRDLNVSQDRATLLLCDNLSAVYLSTNPALHKKSKHFDRDWHYIREQVALGLIETRHIPAELQVADIFTKPLPRKEFVHLRGKLGVGVNPTQSLRGDESVTQMQSEPNKKIMAQVASETHSHQRSFSPLNLSSSITEQRCTESTQLRLSNPFAPLLECCAG